MKVDGDRSFTCDEVNAAADRWVRYQKRHHRIRDPKFSRQRFVQGATSWLSFLGRLQQPAPEILADAELIHEFSRYMNEERCLSPRTIANRSWHVHAFLRWLDEQGGCVAALKLEQVDAFLALKRSQGYCRVSIATVVKALRAFFRYAASQGRCTPVLASGIEGPKLFSHESLPEGPEWEDVRRLITDAAASERPQDVRDYAILLFLAVYGLRAGEVVCLTLDDIDWEHEIIHISRPKQRCKQDYPLIATVGEAILRYLQEVRPHCASRALFITMRAPFRALASQSLHYVVSSRMKSLNIRSPRKGPHSLRHACATRLMAERLSLKEIGDHLGHRSAYATRTYAKVDLPGLREVANVSLGGLL
jgi:site-specific recombinase XerD